MNQSTKANKGLIKGRSRAFIISLMIHGGLIFFASIFVAVTIIQKEEAKFVPPPQIERPKMDLKKPQVKVNKTTKPRSAKRISVDSPVGVPELALPEMSGFGGSLASAMNGYELTPDISSFSVLGSSMSVESGNDLIGTYYSLSHDRAGEEITTSESAFEKALNDFHKSGWNPRVLAEYYRSPQKLYTTHFCIAAVPLAKIPKLFGINDDMWNPRNSMVHYKGKIMSKKGGRYRLWGVGDGYMAIRLNNEIVLEDGYQANSGKISGWLPSDRESNRYGLVRHLSTIGDWFELEPNQEYDIEFLGANVAGSCTWVVTIEDESVDYEETPDGGKFLPVFRTAPFADIVREEIEYVTYREYLDLEGGEIFNVY